MNPIQARTIVELIIGAMLAGGGHVTQAFLALTPRLGWQAYHWMIERGRFRLLGPITALCGIIRREVRGRCFAIIDDTLAPRSSARAPCYPSDSRRPRQHTICCGYAGKTSIYMVCAA